MTTSMPHGSQQFQGFRFLFRYTIRELVLALTIVALLSAWIVEHSKYVALRSHCDVLQWKYSSLVDILRNDNFGVNVTDDTVTFTWYTQDSRFPVTRTRETTVALALVAAGRLAPSNLKRNWSRD